MGVFKTLFRDARALLLTVLLLALAGAFWGSSRYPSLNRKAMMSGDTRMAMGDGLSFDAWLSHSVGEGWFREFLLTFLNWVATNKNGMLFGLSFAIVLMSLIKLVKSQVQFRPNPITASFTGLFLGMPLGVCVNCAAPIAYGVYRSGSRAETALATMVSSPTLNVVVLSMMFNLFPWPIAAIKLGITLLTILVVIPLLVRFVPQECHYRPESEAEKCELNPELEAAKIEKPEKRGPVADVLWVGKELGRNCLTIAWRMIPLMLLAGILGSLAVTLLPWDEMVKMVEGAGRVRGLALIFVLAGVGLLLPVPMAFDVIIVATLLSAGLPMKYAGTLLFVLGGFSVYSFLVLLRARLGRTAVLLAFCFIGLGVFAGYASQYADRWYVDHVRDRYYSALLDPDEGRHQVDRPTRTKAVADIDSPKLAWITNEQHPQIDGRKFRPQERSANWHFERIANPGFKPHPRPLVHARIIPFAHANSLAAGDINGDDWMDLIVGSSRGIFCYVNAGGRFELVKLPALDSIDAPIGALALADFDNNGELDLFFSQFNEGDFVSLQQGGHFQKPTRLPAPPAFFTRAVAIGDIDRNGELDIVLGRNNGIGFRFDSPKESQNYIVYQHDGEFRAEPSPAEPAETLTLLLSDLNDDGWLDLLVGNDFDEPDFYFWGGEDQLKPWEDNGSVTTTTTTMSLDSADVDNDLRLDTYHAQITTRVEGAPRLRRKTVRSLPAGNCSDVADPECLRARSRLAISYQPNGITRCNILPPTRRNDCIATTVALNVWFDRTNSQQLYLDLHYPEIAQVYQRLLSQTVNWRALDESATNAMPEEFDQNLLQLNIGAGDERVREKAKELELEESGWSWNAMFADYDADGRQDLFVVNGASGVNRLSENVFFHNQGDKPWTRIAAQIGLEDFDATGGYVSIDLDNDGDLDLVTYSFDGDLRAYRNHTTGNESVQLVLQDEIGNREGIGSRVIIRHGDQSQMREIKASGGHNSHNPHQLHFGIGDSESVNRIEIRWSTGETNVFNGPFARGHIWRIRRQTSP